MTSAASRPGSDRAGLATTINEEKENERSAD
jgi:hypothetical protein